MKILKMYPDVLVGFSEIMDEICPERERADDLLFDELVLSFDTTKALGIGSSSLKGIRNEFYRGNVRTYNGYTWADKSLCEYIFGFSLTMAHVHNFSVFMRYFKLLIIALLFYQFRHKIFNLAFVSF